MNEQQRPHPYLTREETNGLLETLGFTFEPDGQLHDTPGDRLKFDALERLIAASIAEWVDLGPTDADLTDMDIHIGDNLTEEQVATAWDRLTNELREWAQEYLVG